MEQQNQAIRWLDIPNYESLNYSFDTYGATEPNKFKEYVKIFWHNY